MPKRKWVLLIALTLGASPCATIAADLGVERPTNASPRRGPEQFRFEDYEYAGSLRATAEAIRAGPLRAFPVGSDVDALIGLIERREPLRGRYCEERTEDMVWCQYWQPWSAHPKISTMYWIRIYHQDEPRKIKDIGVKVVTG